VKWEVHSKPPLDLSSLLQESAASRLACVAAAVAVVAAADILANVAHPALDVFSHAGFFGVFGCEYYHYWVGHSVHPNHFSDHGDPAAKEALAFSAAHCGVISEMIGNFFVLAFATWACAPDAHGVLQAVWAMMINSCCAVLASSFLCSWAAGSDRMSPHAAANDTYEVLEAAVASADAHVPLTYASQNGLQEVLKLDASCWIY